MNEQDNGQVRAPAQSQGGTAQSGPAGFGDAPRFTVDKKTAKKNEAVLGPFTIRDLTVFGSTLLLFISSLIPMFASAYNLWNLGSLFFLGLGIVLPLIVTALFVARRLSPGTRIRIGSLSIDQFASVVASFTLTFFFLAAAGAFVPSMLIALLGAAGLFTATVLARWIPLFAGDFTGRPETPAHVMAREAVAPVQKPRAPKTPKQPKPAKDSSDASKAAASGTAAGWAQRPATGGQGAAPAVSPVVSGAGAAAAGAAAAAAGAAPAATPGSPASSAPATQLSGVVPAAGASSPAPVLSAGSSTSTSAPSAGEPAPSAEPVPSATAPAAASPTAAEQTRAAGVAVAAPAAAAAEQAQTAASSAAASPSAAEQTQTAAAPAASGGSAPTTVNPQVRPQEQVRAQEPIGATVDPASRPAEDGVHPAHEAFWFAVAQPRTAVDERTGAPAFVIEPGGWVLALEDRGTSFLVQHTDGRLGVLRDLSNIERG